MTPSLNYTELVIELWEACRSRRPKLTLSLLGLGSSLGGLEEVRAACQLFLDCEVRAAEHGHELPCFVAAARDYATQVSKHWAKGNIPFEVGELESIAYKVIKKYEEK